VQPSITIVIPNFNGKDLLDNNLPSVIAAAGAAGAAILVVDDGSTDDSVRWLRSTYSGRVGLLEMKENRGFAHAANEGARSASTRIVYFLNTDIRVREEFLAPIRRISTTPHVSPCPAWQWTHPECGRSPPRTGCAGDGDSST